MLKTVSTQLALASDTLSEILAKGNTTGGTDLAVSAGDDITFADNSKAIFGDGSDLSIYSDGTTGQVTGSVNVTGAATFGGLVAATGTGAAASLRGTGNGGLELYNTASDQQVNMDLNTPGTYRIANYYGTGSTMVFATNPNGGGSTVALTIAPTGAATFSDNVIIGTSGKGIDFSATAGTGTSELLDDYEEGTFTMTASRITDLTTNVGRYTKIGNIVTCEINLSWTATDNSGNAVIFEGLPFTTATGTETSTGPVLIYGTDINTDVGAATVLRIDDNQTRFFLNKAMDASFASINSSQMNSATTLRSTFSYTAS
jgi:hypothetical protein